MGTHGPLPKRSEQRRRTNKPAKPLTKSAAKAPFKAPIRANPKWHPVAKRWFDSLGRSGQAAFYVASDWATAYVLAESMSRELKPQPVVVGKGEDAEVKLLELPPKAASIAAWLKGMTALLVTEGDRRRAALELQLPAPPKNGDGDVAWFDDARKRLRGAG